jgi:hypothetical protein
MNFSKFIYFADCAGCPDYNYFTPFVKVKIGDSGVLGSGRVLRGVIRRASCPNVVRPTRVVRTRQLTPVSIMSREIR